MTSAGAMAGEKEAEGEVVVAPQGGGGERERRNGFEKGVPTISINEDDSGQFELVPPDGGWGWMVALGALTITTLLPMMGPCFGILFSRYLLELGTSSTTTAWIFNTQAFVWNISGLMTRPLAKEFGWRRVGFMGAFLTSVALIISAFSPTAEFLFFSFSLLSGLGGGTVVGMCFIIVPLYFDKRRGQANAIMMAGVCLGQVIGPPFVEFLQEEYGFKGATLLMGAIFLHACLGAMFFHPVSWHQKRRRVQCVADTNEPLLPPPKYSDAPHFVKTRSAVSLGDGRLVGGDMHVEMVKRGMLPRNRTTSFRSRGSFHSLGGSSLALSSLDLPGMPPVTIEEATKETSSGGIIGILRRVMRSTISDLGALRSPRALIIALGGTLCINGYLNFVMMVPFAMQAEGFTLQDAAFCISISAICNLLMRMAVSFLSDWPRFNVRVCYVTGFGLISAMMFVFPLLTELWMMLVVMGVWGCGVGINMGVYNLIMISVMGIEQLPAVFGSSCFMVAIGFIIIGPCIGKVRDVSGSYQISMNIPAAMLLLAVVLWFFMPKDKLEDKPRHHEDEEAAKVKEKLVEGAA